jgi:crossover junction endodeoxyribonuclease RuvC
MRWIGIDPGLRTTGFGVIDVDGQKLTYVASGTIESGDPAKGLPERLGTLYAGIKEVLDTYKPESAAIEEVFLNVNPRSTLMLGQARGAVIAALVSEKLPVAEYSALRVKQAIVGTGRAAKPQVQEMVKRLLRLNRAPGTDASDALGVAICAAHHAQIPKAITAAIAPKKVLSVSSNATVRLSIRTVWMTMSPRPMPLPAIRPRGPRPYRGPMAIP